MNNKIIKHNLVSKIKLFTLLVFTTASFLIFYSKAFAFTEPPYIPVNKHTAVDGNNMVTSCSGTQYYVDDDCASGGTGTANQANGVCSGATRAFATLAAAQSAMVAGDCVKIHAGTYIYNSGFQWSKSGTPSHETIIEAYGDGDAIMEMHGTTNGSQFSVSGTYIIFDGGPNRQLVFDGNYLTTTPMDNIRTDDYTIARYITLSRLTTRYAMKSACQGDGSGFGASGDNIKIYNNLSYGNCYAGIYVEGGTPVNTGGQNIEVRNNIFRDNQGSGIQANPHNFNTHGADNLIISGNVVYNNGYRGAGYVYYGYRPGITVLSNINSLKNVYIYDNILWHNKDAEIQVSNDSIINARIYNNTLYNGSGYGIYIYSPGATVSLINNIIYQMAGGNQMSGIQTIANNALSNPNFLSTTETDADYLKLSSSSTNAIDLGAIIGTYPELDAIITTDYFGNISPTNGRRDIGAYEYPSGGGDTIAPSAPTGVTVI